VLGNLQQAGNSCQDSMLKSTMRLMETLRDTTSKADFVNLLQSVHERLGDVESLDPG
jgi:hypothetical protein